MNGGDRDIETIKLNLFFSFIISSVSSVKKLLPLSLSGDNQDSSGRLYK